MTTVWESGYYANSRPELHDLVPHNVSKLLDIGCGEGAFGAALRSKRPGLSVWGVEMNSDAAAMAATHYEEVLLGSYPDVAWPDGLLFDCVAFNDVLEHMTDPWGALTQSRQILSPGGVVIVSLPNIASFGIIRQLLRDEFTYADSGVLDRTHVRFFTRTTAIGMAERAGFAVRHVRHSWPHVDGWRRRMIGMLGLSRFNGRQVVLVLEPR